MRLEVFDAMGRSANVLVNAPLPAGSHVAAWSAGDLPSGVYMVRLDAGTHATNRTMVLAK